MHRTSRPPHTLFAHCRLVLREIRMLWGTPATIMDQRAVNRAEHRRMTNWIGNLEQLVRLIVIGMALALRLPPPRIDTRARVPRPRRYAIWWPTRPRTWIAPFRMFRAPRTYVRRVKRKRLFVRRFVETATLARRLEAVARVVANPRPYAYSAARTLARWQAVNRVSNEPRDLHPLLVPRPRTPRYKRDLGQRAVEPAFSQAWAIAAPRIEAFLGRAPDPG